MSEADVAIRLQGAGKRYTKFVDQPMLTRRLRLRSRSRRSHLWALRGVDAEVGRGECVGVIGRNGSGKSTLLGMLAGVTAPTEGRVEIHGRVAPLVSVGVGFHPELTGRENVYVNGTILGMSRAEIDARFEEIVEFADIGDFMDTPVKFYSSGMYVRLGFSVAIRADPDVLLVDEVLAVGDFAFQLRCFDRMAEIKKSGTTIVIVSHNLSAVRVLCERTLLLDGGALRYDGATSEAISRYHLVTGEERELEDEDADALGDYETSPSFARVTLRQTDSAGQQTRHVSAGETTVFVVECRARVDIDEPKVGITITGARGEHVYSDVTAVRATPRRLHAGEPYACSVTLQAWLAGGSYNVRAVLYAADMSEVVATTPRSQFFVAGRPMVEGVADLGARFEAVDASAELGAST